MGWPKNAIYAFFGESLGRRIVASFSWFIGRQLDEGGTTAVANAQQALVDIKTTIVRFQEGVAKTGGAYERVKKLYELKKAEAKSLEVQAQQLVAAGKEELAVQILDQLVVLEELLPQQEQRAREAEALFRQAKEALDNEKERLTKMEFRLSNMKDQTEFDNAIQDLLAATNTMDISSAKSEFDRAEKGVQKRASNNKVAAELQESPADKAQSEIKSITRSSDAAKRLEALKAGQLEHDKPVNLPSADFDRSNKTL